MSVSSRLPTWACRWLCPKNFRPVLNNTCLPAQKNIVVANAAFGIQVMERGQKSIDECIEIARESIDSGAALNAFRRFVTINS